MMIIAIALAAATAAPPDPDLATARSVLLDKLRDPTHAQLRGWHAQASPYSSDVYYCGEVNAPNAYGGMTGWHRARVTLKGSFMEDDGRDAQDVLDRLCPSAPGAPDVSAALAPS